MDTSGVVFSISRQYEEFSIKYSLYSGGRELVCYSVRIEKHANNGDALDVEAVVLSESKKAAEQVLRTLHEHEVMPIHLYEVVDGILDRMACNLSKSH